MKMALFAKIGTFIKLFFVWIHTSGFEMIGWAIEDYRRNRIIDAILQIICGIAIILFALSIYLLFIYGIWVLFSVL